MSPLWAPLPTMAALSVRLGHKPDGKAPQTARFSAGAGEFKKAQLLQRLSGGAKGTRNPNMGYANSLKCRDFFDDVGPRECCAAPKSCSPFAWGAFIRSE